ncbi:MULTISPECIES: hypothetical protein [Pseudomonas]|uniref:Uncharacterized protein n=1 Tax=Pseudomonas fluorescens TaxID=294 RepID=A0A162BIL9_PSEFL|nr:MULTISPECIES: hypothetical protein [Pseudomonas]KZN16193.1 hypothetical protein A1D17_08495 [Pseudomonas fluorescens]
MLEREIVIRFTWASVVRALCLSPAVVIPLCLLLYLPWGSANAPAWVQAVGSIAAIIAAWLIPYQHEQMRARKQKEDLLASVAWLAFRVKNSFDHMAGVIDRSEPDDRNRWLFLSQPNSWVIHRDAAREFPLTGFTSDEIALLLSLRSITEFGVSCAETLRTWDFDHSPHLAHDFPHNEGIVFHRPQIDWVLRQLSRDVPHQDHA